MHGFLSYSPATVVRIPQTGVLGADRGACLPGRDLPASEVRSSQLARIEPAAASWNKPAATGAKISRRQLRGSLQTCVLASIAAPELPGMDLLASDGAQLKKEAKAFL